MNRRTGAIAAIAAGLTLLASRVPAPDPARFQQALRAMNADGQLGLRALVFEAGSAWQRAGIAIDLRVVAVAVAALGLGGFSHLALHLWRSRPGPLVARTAPASLPRDRRVAQARALADKGRLNIDVARRTTLSRDAVDLLTMLPRPDAAVTRRRTFRSRTFRSTRSRSMVA